MAGRRRPAAGARGKALAARPRPTRRGFDAFIDIVPGDVPAALEALGLPVLRVDESGEATAKCPAHLERTGREDRHPSFSVNIESGLYGCWSCQFRGTFVSLVKYVLGCEHADAVAWVRAQGTIQRVERVLAKRRAKELDTTEEINEAKLALYVPPPPKALASRRLTAASCARYGVLWDAENARWITPVRDAAGQLQGWQEKNARYFKNRPKGLKKSQFLFGYSSMPSRVDRIVLVESPLDSPRVDSAGIEWALSSYGASVSDAQMALISERTRHLVLFQDCDSAGRIARDKVLQSWTRRGLAISCVDYRLLDRDALDGLDPGKLDDEEIVHMVDGAIPASIFALTFR